MSSDNPTTGSIAVANPDMSRQRRASITSNNLTNLFQRRNSTSAGTTSVFPNPIATAAMGDQRRRLSITTLGLSGTSPTNPMQFGGGARRGSLSTNSSDAIEENAIVDDDDSASGPRTGPNTPFTRRMSFGAQAMRNLRTPGAGSPGSNDQGFNWSEQLRSRAESSVGSGGAARPSFSLATGLSGSPPRAGAGAPSSSVSPHHERAKSVSDMPAPPTQSPRPRQPKKPDHFQERILKGDFYMD
ncbi:hypothetical protein VTK73DRAFT_8718 [Phialemonium thermophilum]|uniref:Uncharacterized protein n=1 Tax=Phialemonium thermophilum TaxID=223376 RepID=A0ABR3XMY4_9PEZI